MMNAPSTEQYRVKPPTIPAALIPADFPIGCGDAGAGRPTVLLHCSGADRHHWDRMVKAWSGAETAPRRFLRPELFGYGQTGKWPGTGQIALRDYVHLVAAALADIDESVDLVGHSFGGAVALHFAHCMPERVRSLTLIEPAAFFLLRDAEGTEDILFRQIAEVGRAVQLGAALGSEESCRSGMAYFVNYWNGPGRWNALPPAVQQEMAKLADVIGLEFIAAFAEKTRLRDCRDIRMPALLISGTLSPEPVRHIIKMLESAMPAAEAVCIHDAGHMTPLTHATQLAELISGWQRGVSDR